MNHTLVLQSHATPRPHAWIDACLDSVRRWSAVNGYEYEFVGDELFDFVPPLLREKIRDQRVIATDLGRLRLLQSRIDAGFETVIWCDADFLIFDPDNFVIPGCAYALGREVWVQHAPDNSSQLSAHVKVHNAFLMFRRGNVFLDFYADTAERLLSRNQGRMPPQFIGPKLLTALHNVAQCPVLETAGMLSPLLIEEIATRPGPALELFGRRSSRAPAAANLCASLCDNDTVSAGSVTTCIARLIEQPSVLTGACIT